MKILPSHDGSYPCPDKFLQFFKDINARFQLPSLIPPRPPDIVNFPVMRSNSSLKDEYWKVGGRRFASR